MKSTTVFTIVLCSILAQIASAQSILQDYFNGNKDSMLAQANMLVQLPEPTFRTFIPINAESEIAPKKAFKTENHYFRARDGKALFAYRFSHKSANTILLVHGVKSTAKECLPTAHLLQSATKAEVFAIDLRGHGNSEGKDGDVDYINQYADDLADIVRAIRKEKPKGKVILAGHSMGGGVALRYAMSESKDPVDGYLLLAPLLGHDSPALPQAETIENDSIEPFMKIHIARIIGLKMLNELGIHDFDHLPVMLFNLPENAASRVYTYRANMSMAPESYAEGLKAVSTPLLVLIGAKDEAFDAKIMQKTTLENSKGEAHILEGVTHDGILEEPGICGFVTKWFARL